MSNFKRPKSEKLVFERDFLKSKAYLSLSATAIKVLNFFHMRKIMVKSKGRDREKWIIANNGDIIFTYDEALKLGFTKRAFRDALDRLIKTGFIKINHSGGGLKGDSSTYFISEEWVNYGTDKLKIQERETNKRLSLIMKENRKNRKTKSSNIIVTATSNQIVTGDLKQANRL